MLHLIVYVIQRYVIHKMYSSWGHKDERSVDTKVQVHFPDFNAGNIYEMILID